jgi:hypothetical protein
VLGNNPFELVWRVAIAVGDHDLIALEKAGTAAADQFQARVLAELVNAGQQQVTSLWAQVTAEKLNWLVLVDAAGGIGPLGLFEALFRQGLKL